MAAYMQAMAQQPTETDRRDEEQVEPIRLTPREAAFLAKLMRDAANRPPTILKFKRSSSALEMLPFEAGDFSGNIDRSFMHAKELPSFDRLSKFQNVSPRLVWKNHLRLFSMSFVGSLLVVEIVAELFKEPNFNSTLPGITAAFLIAVIITSVESSRNASAG